MWWPQDRLSLVCLLTWGSHSSMQAMHHSSVTIWGARGWRTGWARWEGQGSSSQVLPVASCLLTCSSETWGLMAGLTFAWNPQPFAEELSLKRHLSLRLIPPPRGGWGLHHFFFTRASFCPGGHPLPILLGLFWESWRVLTSKSQGSALWFRIPSNYMTKSLHFSLPHFLPFYNGAWRVSAVTT